MVGCTFASRITCIVTTSRINDCLCLRQPFLCCVDFGNVEVVDLSHGEWLAHFGHPLLPGLVADQRDPFNLRAVSGRELNVVPQGMQVPTLKVVELGQQTYLALLSHGGIDDRDKILVVLVVEFTGEPETENILRTLWNLLNHSRLLLGFDSCGLCTRRFYGFGHLLKR